MLIFQNNFQHFIIFYMYSKRKYCCLFFIIVFFFSPFVSDGQNSSSPNFLISESGNFGFIITHRNNIGNLIKGHIYGPELSFIIPTNGSKPWHQIHKYPEIGLSFIHLYLSNPTQLGNLEALYPYVNFRLNKLQGKLNLNFRVGVGLAFLTKSFDRIENHQNNVIGSRLNGAVILRFNANILLTKALRMETGMGLTHASNGAIRTPNLGLNMATVNLGLTYAFGNKELNIEPHTFAPSYKKWQSSFIAVLGLKELETPGGNKYLAVGVQANSYRIINNKINFGAGIEMAYNNATKKMWLNTSILNKSTADIIQVGAKICYSYNLTRLSMPIDFGVYVYKKQTYNGMFFHRIGLRYLLNQHLVINATLLTHWAKADYFEWGLGYQF